MTWITTIPIAHRGLHGSEVPENSLSAFTNAIHHRYAIELDVQLSSDGEIMVFHDENLARMTGVNQTIHTQKFSSLSKVFLKDTRERIPTLPEVLELIDGKTPLLIETKNKFCSGPLEEKLARVLENYSGEYAVQSFNPYSLEWFHRNCPSVLRGQLSCDFRNEDMVLYKKIALRYLLMNWMSKPDFIVYDIDVLPCWSVIRLRKKGIPVLTDNVNNMQKLEKAKMYGDNIIFEGVLP